MARVDDQIEFDGKIYYAAFSSTDNIYHSPVFDSREAYSQWIIDNKFYGFTGTLEEAVKSIVAEYQPLRLSSEDFTRAKKAIKILASGQLLSPELHNSLKRIYSLTARLLGDYPDHLIPAIKEESIEGKINEFGFNNPEDSSMSYAGNMSSEYLSNFENQSDYQSNELKFIGWFVGAYVNYLNSLFSGSLPELFEKALSLRTKKI